MCAVVAKWFNLLWILLPSWVKWVWLSVSYVLVSPDVSQHLWKPETVPWFPFRETSFACVYPQKGRNQGALPLWGWGGHAINLGNMSDSGDTLRMIKALCSVGHSSAQTGERLFLRSKTSPRSQVLWWPHFSSSLASSVSWPLERIFSASVLQGHLLCLWLKQLLQLRAPEDGRSHGDFKLHLRMWTSHLKSHQFA